MAPGVPVSGAWCVESAALVVPFTHWVPVTHHRTVVRTCHWCASTKFPAGINLVKTVAPDWRPSELLLALDLIIIPALTALAILSPVDKIKVCKIEKPRSLAPVFDQMILKH